MLQVRQGSGTTVTPQVMWNMLDELVLAASIAEESVPCESHWSALESTTLASLDARFNGVYLQHYFGPEDKRNHNAILAAAKAQVQWLDILDRHLPHHLRKHRTRLRGINAN